MDGPIPKLAPKLPPKLEPKLASQLAPILAPKLAPMLESKLAPKFAPIFAPTLVVVPKVRVVRRCGTPGSEICLLTVAERANHRDCTVIKQLLWRNCNYYL